MSEIQNIAIKRALQLLKSAGAQYIVLDAAGEQHIHGDLQLAPVKATSKRRPAGTFSAIYVPHLRNLGPGQSTLIPWGNIEGEDREHLRSSASAWACVKWGKGSHISHCNDLGMEILRLGDA